MVSIRATQPGNGIYAAAPDVATSFRVKAAPVNVYFAAVTNPTTTAKVGEMAAVLTPKTNQCSVLIVAPEAGINTSVVFKIAANGDFSANISSLSVSLAGAPVSGEPQRAAAPTPYSLRGKLMNGRLQGVIDPLGISFDAPVLSADGPSASSAGFYESTALGSGTGKTYAVVGSGNQVLTLASTPEATVGGVTQLKADRTIEFGGSAIRALSMEGRMTVCNMAIEAGARAGLVAVDDKTIEYVKGRLLSPTGVEWDHAVTYWKTLQSDAGAHFDAVVEINAADIVPQVTWGTSPEMVLGINGIVPDPDKEKDANKRDAIERALTYMGLQPGKALNDIFVDKVFIGSCTNSRIEDMREAAALVKKLGQKVSKTVKLAMVVPGSGLVKEQAEREGLHEIFKAAGFEWREPGCSMCLAMNADRLEPGERCASTSNRNFEGRQGAGGRTHLVSPAMAAAAAIHGHFVDIRQFA